MMKFLRSVAPAIVFALTLPCLAQEPKGGDPFQAQLKLCEAINGGDAKAVAAALDAGAKLSQPCPKEMVPPLHQAVESGKAEIVSLLLDRGADVNQPDNGVSAAPLHYAAAKEDPALVSLLLKRGAKVDALTDEGVSALGMAVLSHDSAAVAQALIDAGADVNAVDEQGDTLLDTARAMGRQKVAALLESKGAKPGEEPGMPVEIASGVTTPTAQTPSSPTGAKRTPEGQLLFKGLWPGMPVQQAAARLKQLGLPPGESVITGRTRRDGQDVDVWEFRESDKIDGSGSLSRNGDERWTLWYDSQTGRVTKFQFRWSAVASLFNCGDMEMRQLAQTFMDAYAIPAMESVATHNWGFEYTDPAGWKVRIEEDRTLVVDAVATATQRAFD